jgi:cleavage and polyadenylation specificity factor subunit 5
MSFVNSHVDVFPYSNYLVREYFDEVALEEPSSSTAATRSRAWSEKDQSGPKKMLRLKERYERQQQATVVSVEAVLLVHMHSHPHVILLKHKATGMWRLPGGKSKLGEDPQEALLRKLHRKLAVGTELPTTTGAFGETPHRVDGTGKVVGSSSDIFRIVDILSEWYRPNFDPLMYPYRPPHVTKEKEARVLFLVQLSTEAVFTLRPTFEMIVVPLFDLHDNAAKYGSIIASIPLSLSRVHINLS